METKINVEKVEEIKYEDPNVMIERCTEYITNIDDELEGEMLGLLQDCEKKEYTCAYERLTQIDILNSIRGNLFELRKNARMRKL